MIPRRPVRSIFAVLVLASFPAAGQTLDDDGRDGGAPIEIAADRMEVERSAGRAVFIGDVDVERGDMALRADKLVVHYREGDDGGETIHFIEALGNVFLATPDETARGDTGAYDIDAGVVRLAGNVVLTNADTVLRGSEATVNLETGRSLVTGGADRVNVLFDADADDN